MRARVVSCLALVCALAVAAPLAAQKAPAPTLVTGTVLGSDGKPMKLAHARVLALMQGEAIAIATASVDGQFALAVTRPGAYYLEFTGVDHKPLRIPLVTGRGATIALDARLERNSYSSTLDSIAAIGDWNRFSRSSARPLVKQPDGRYTLEVESSAREVAYQLVGLGADGEAINGTDAHHHVFDGNASYRSVVEVHDETATIVFDPRLLDRAPSVARVVFRDRSSYMARAHEIFSVSDGWQDKFLAASRAARVPNDRLGFDWSPAFRDLGGHLARERDPGLRELILTRLVHFSSSYGARLDTALAGRIVRELPPSSVWWAFVFNGGPGTMTFAMQQVTHPTLRPSPIPADSAQARRVLAYIDRAVAENPEPIARANALGVAVVVLMGGQDVDRANRYYTRLVSEYPDAPFGPMLRAQFAPNRVLRPGATIPDYHFTALRDTTAVFTRESMKGKVYLLDFWASWCTGCVKEMPYLHETYSRFAPKGFEILSVSVDLQPEDVARFRAGEWKMPWSHTIIPGGLGGPTLRPFEVTFIPRAVLVDRDGKIIAVDDAVRGERLKKAVEEALK